VSRIPLEAIREVERVQAESPPLDLRLLFSSGAMEGPFTAKDGQALEFTPGMVLVDADEAAA